MKLIFAGASLRADRDHNARAWLAWHVEALRRAKKLPRLDRLTVKAKRNRRQPQPWQQQAQIMAVWAAKIERAIAMRNAIGKE